MKKITHLVGIDLETTDISIETGAIIEIGAAKISIQDDSWEIEEEFNSLCKWLPDNKFKTIYTVEAMKITKIRPEELLDYPDLDNVFWDLLEEMKILDGHTALIAHNAPFERAHINQSLQRYDLPLWDTVIYDSIEATNFLFPEAASHALQKLASYIGINVRTAHRAYNDVCTMFKVLKFGCERKNWSIEKMVSGMFPLQMNVMAYEDQSRNFYTLGDDLIWLKTLLEAGEKYV